MTGFVEDGPARPIRVSAMARQRDLNPAGFVALGLRSHAMARRDP